MSEYTFDPYFNTVFRELKEKPLPDLPAVTDEKSTESSLP